MVDVLRIDLRGGERPLSLLPDRRSGVVYYWSLGVRDGCASPEIQSAIPVGRLTKRRLGVVARLLRSRSVGGEHRPYKTLSRKTHFSDLRLGEITR